MFGISTGFTGRRTMGLGAVKLADMEEYIRVVQALWRGETVRIRDRGQAAPDPLPQPRPRPDQHRTIRSRSTSPPPGPRARVLTAKLGAGWIDNVADPERGIAALEQMRTAWQAAGHARDSLTAVAWIGGAVLDEGEPADSPRGMAIGGTARRRCCCIARPIRRWPTIPRRSRCVPEFAETVEAYVAHARSFGPQGAYYLENHRGHLMFVRPDERPYITAEMIKGTTFIGTEREIKQRVGALADAGFAQVVVSIPPGQEHAIEDWGRIRRAFG